MNCMKCGREMDSEQAFCADCLLEMKKYPVNPDIHVHLPVRSQAAAPRKHPTRHRAVNPEEQIKKLKKRVWTLSAVLAVTLALLCTMIYPTVNYYIRHYNRRPGQNYNTVTTTETIEIPLD